VTEGRTERPGPAGAAGPVPGPRWALDAAAAAVPTTGEPYAVFVRCRGLELGLYAPRGRDDQTPHDRDEVYVVARGRGTFVRAGERVPFEPGDALYVPAGVEHRFEDFSEDLLVWVVFCGPGPGG
jgi:mannose-6-phosphate isomerase-like protein (cupin superfamily)